MLPVPIRRPDTKESESAAVTTPMPPIWIRNRMTACPKGDQWVTVSRTTSPVTQTAEVAVNRQSENPVPACSMSETGSISKSVPTRIISTNPSAMIWKVVIR